MSDNQMLVNIIENYRVKNNYTKAEISRFMDRSPGYWSKVSNNYIDLSDDALTNFIANRKMSFGDLYALYEKSKKISYSSKISIHNNKNIGATKKYKITSDTIKRDEAMFQIFIFCLFAIVIGVLVACITTIVAFS